MNNQMRQISELSDGRLIDSLEKNSEQFTEEYTQLAKQELLIRIKKNPEIYKSVHIEKKNWEISCIEKKITRLKTTMATLLTFIPFSVYITLKSVNSSVLKTGILSGVLCGIVGFIFLTMISHEKKKKSHIESDY